MMRLTRLSSSYSTASGTSFDNFDILPIRPEMYVLPSICWSQDFKTMLKRLSAPKLVYISLQLRLEVNLGDPTQNKQETHTYVLGLFVARIVILGTLRFLRNKDTRILCNYFLNFFCVFGILNNTKAVHQSTLHFYDCH